MKPLRKNTSKFLCVGLVSILAMSSALADGGYLDTKRNRISYSKHGYIDKAGNLVFHVASKANTGSFSDGRASVRNETYAFIERSGKTVIPGPFKIADSFTEGLAAVGYYGKFGFIDKQGNLVIDALYDSTSAFSNGLAAVEIEKKIGFIDTRGNWKVEPRFSYVDGFSEDVCLVSIPNSPGKTNGFIDKAGRILFYLDHPKYDSIYSQNLFGSDKALSISSGEFGGISKVSASTATFSEGLAAMPQESGGKIGYADKKGIFKIQPRFDQAYPFSEGLAVVIVDKKCGFVNKQGKIVIAPAFLQARSFSEGLAAVEVEKNKWGFIDRTGKMVINPQFAYSWSFAEGLAHVRYSETD